MSVKQNEITDWIQNRIKRDEIDKYRDHEDSFIDDKLIHGVLGGSKNPDKKLINDILQKSLSVETLSLNETSALLNVSDPETLTLMEETAKKIKQKVYDNRIVTFAPLYMGNLCVNNCLYCGFRTGNPSADRKVLTMDEVKKETEMLAGKIGHKRLIVVYGEHPYTGADYIRKTLENIYSVKVKTKNGYGQIRRANVNAAPMQINELKMLKEVGIGTYQVFQETYHKGTYGKVHPEGTLKSDYNWRLYCMHRALEAGVDDVGLGVLFGLYDWRFEVMGLVAHSLELEKKFNIGAHTISFPRIEPASNAPFSEKTKYEVSDEDFKRIIVTLRLAVPHTGMIITAREDRQLRDQTIHLGCTQTDASTKIGIGAYSADKDTQAINKQQFMLGDTRTLDELVFDLTKMGYITSFCTAGYRCGRTGECILELLKSGQEGKFCKLNAILTFREWLDDFASFKTKQAGEMLIEKEIAEVKHKIPSAYKTLVEYYGRIEKGERDLYF